MSLYFLCCSVDVSVCLVCCVFVIAMCLGVVAVLLLNVMDVFSVGGGALLDRPCMDRPCMDRPCIFLCFCMSEVISSFKSLRAGSQVFALLILFLWVILHTMWSGKSLQLLCILPFGMLCLSAISMMFVKLCWQCVCWWVWWSEHELCTVSFLVIDESPLVLL